MNKTYTHCHPLSCQPLFFFHNSVSVRVIWYTCYNFVYLKECLKYSYIISSDIHAFWLVFTYDLLEDRCIDDDSARFMFDSHVILWTNHNSLLSIATNQFASFCIDNRLRQSAIFMSVKVAKFEIRRRFSVYFNSLLHKTNRFHVIVCLFSNRSQRTSKLHSQIEDGDSSFESRLSTYFWLVLYIHNNKYHMFTFQNFFMTFSVFLTSFKAFIFPLKEEICSNLKEKTLRLTNMSH